MKIGDLLDRYWRVKPRSLTAANTVNAISDFPKPFLLNANSALGGAVNVEEI
jgi:hypothetical protein